MELGNVAQWAAAFVTTAGILVALFKEAIIRLWRYPRLTVTIKAKDPYIVKTPDRMN